MQGYSRNASPTAGRHSGGTALRLSRSLESLKYRPQLLVTYDNERLPIESEKAIGTIGNRQ